VCWLRKNKIEIFFLIVLGIIINVRHYLELHGYCINFIDVDDYMRLVRIRDFFNHHDLSNTIISRSNVPFGCDLHWTRFYDFFLIIPSYILNFFLNSIDKSIEYVGFFIGPVIRSVSIALFLSIAQKLMKEEDAFLLTALMAANPFILIFGLFGRPDHHSFIMLFILIYLHTIMGFVESQLKSKFLCIKAAVVASLCVWISPETLIPILLIDGVLFIYAFFDLEKLKSLHMKSILTVCGVGIITFSFSNLPISYLMTMCVLLLVVFYDTFNTSHITDPIYRYWHMVVLVLVVILFPQISAPVEYDKISIVHTLLFICSALYFGINIIHSELKPMARIAAAIGWFFIIAAMFLFIYPEFLHGMSAGIDDYVKEIWLYRVNEMKSPFSLGSGFFFINYTIVTAIAIVGKISQLIDQKLTPTSIIWWILVINTICYTIFAGISYRMQPYSVLFGLPLIVDFGMNSDFTRSLHRYIRIIISAFFSSLFLFFIVFLDSDAEDLKNQPAKSTYTKEELYELIDNLSPTPVVIMTHINDGPPILYYTKHSVVGASYHRQPQGIISSYKIMSEKYDEKVVQSILKNTGSLYIFIRKSEKSRNRSLARMIMDNDLPKWLSPVKLPEKFNDIAIVQVLGSP
jgi:asparagine N-glycosylation enzyme membrane subunit Stt3